VVRAATVVQCNNNNNGRASIAFLLWMAYNVRDLKWYSAYKTFFWILFLGRGFTTGQAAQRAPQKNTDPALAGSVRTRCPRTHFGLFFGSLLPWLERDRTNGNPLGKCVYFF
jgi:hypothetical protein